MATEYFGSGWLSSMWIGKSSPMVLVCLYIYIYTIRLTAHLINCLHHHTVETKSGPSAPRGEQTNKWNWDQLAFVLCDRDNSSSGLTLNCSSLFGLLLILIVSSDRTRLGRRRRRSRESVLYCHRTGHCRRELDRCRVNSKTDRPTCWYRCHQFDYYYILFCSVRPSSSSPLPLPTFSANRFDTLTLGRGHLWKMCLFQVKWTNEIIFAHRQNGWQDNLAHT